MQFQECEDVSRLHPVLIVHPVQCKGLNRDALSTQLKKLWPSYFKEYQRACLREHLSPAQPMLHDLGTLLGTQYIVTLPIKDHWKETLTPETMRSALQALIDVFQKLKPSSVAIPQIKEAPAGWLQKELKKMAETSHLDWLEEVYLLEAV